MDYDILIIGSGPGGYVAAIRASQLGLKTAIVEKNQLGGICLNWGCIPTKSLLKSAEVLNYIESAKSFGITVEGEIKPEFDKIIERSRRIASQMSKGIEMLFKKNNITVIQGFGQLVSEHEVLVSSGEDKQTITAKNIILATGARAKELPFLKIDGKKVIGYKEALVLKKLPESMTVVGSGAIGVELAFFYASMGTKVTILEALPQIVPNEDADVADLLEKSLKKMKIKVFSGVKINSVNTSESLSTVGIESDGKEQIIESELILSAVGITANIENIGLEKVGITTENGKISVNKLYQTNIQSVFAIGDVIGTPALAHVASAEGIACVEGIAGVLHKGVNYDAIPSCIYTKPEIASVGLNEKLAAKKSIDIETAIFPFTALGKATAIGAREGFVKLVFKKGTKDLVGATMVGANVTEMLGEIGVALNLNAKAKDLLHTMHAHPTMSEGIMEAAAVTEGEVIHI